jgi:Na+/phosphate symporter
MAIYAPALSFLVLIVGLLMYALATNPKVQEIGHVMFQVGLLVFLFQGAPLLLK